MSGISMYQAQPEVDFREASVSHIVDLYLQNGCVLLRDCFDPGALRSMREALDKIYPEIEGPHVYPRDLRERNMPAFQDQLFGPKHREIVDAVYAGGESTISESSASRRVNVTDQSGPWQGPLATHIDALFHGFNFQMNFWTPLHACDANIPRLFVIPAPFAEIIEYTGYDGGPDGTWPAPLERFKSSIKDLYLNNSPDEEYKTRFAPRIWAPEYNLGDAMLSSNWTLHGTYAVPGMTGRRESVEMRMSSVLPLPALIEAHAGVGRSLSRWW